MVIENAERFGLAQLHQLRGRVGRGTAKSSCLLLYQEPLGETAKARLSIMRETEDGFRIAEEDLRLRGAGEMLGTRQSGLPLFRMADLATDGDLLAAARDDAAADPDPRPEAHDTARRGAARPALPVRARRGDQADLRRLTGFRFGRAVLTAATFASSAAGSGRSGKTRPMEITSFNPSSTLMSRIFTSATSAKNR